MKIPHTNDMMWIANSRMQVMRHALNHHLSMPAITMTHLSGWSMIRLLRSRSPSAAPKQPHVFRAVQPIPAGADPRRGNHSLAECHFVEHRPPCPTDDSIAQAASLRRVEAVCAAGRARSARRRSADSMRTASTLGGRFGTRGLPAGSSPNKGFCCSVARLS